jgi:hypothetical protein
VTIAPRAGLEAVQPHPTPLIDRAFHASISNVPAQMIACSRLISADNLADHPQSEA